MKSQLLKTPLPYIALIAAHSIWGANFVIAKFTLEEFPVFILAFLRFLFAAFLITPLFLSVKTKDRIIHRADIFKVLLVGIFLTTLHISLFFEGLKRTTAIDASVLSLITPILSLLAGTWFLKEKIYPINVSGTFIALTGSLIVLELPLLLVGIGSTKNLGGNILILLSGLVLVFGFLIIKEYLQSYPIVVLTATTFIVGAFSFLLPAITQHLSNPLWILQITPNGILGFAFITLLSSITAFFLQFWALQSLDLGKANLVQYIQPAVASFLAVSILHEKISTFFVIGTVLVIIGVYLGTLGKLHHHHQQYKH